MRQADIKIMNYEEVMVLQPGITVVGAKNVTLRDTKIEEIIKLFIGIDNMNAQQIVKEIINDGENSETKWFFKLVLRMLREVSITETEEKPSIGINILILKPVFLPKILIQFYDIMVKAIVDTGAQRSFGSKIL